MRYGQETRVIKILSKIAIKIHFQVILNSQMDKWDAIGKGKVANLNVSW